MIKVNVAGVLIDNISKQDAIAEIDNIIQAGKSSYIVTPYSEMIVFAQENPAYKNVLNHAALALPDGIGILWAAKYLTSKTNVFFSLIKTLVTPNYVYTVIKQRIVGSHLVWDLAKLALNKNYSIALVGGKNSVAQKAAEKLKTKNQKLKINLALSDCEFDDLLISKISQSNSDILLIAYSPPKQEMWLAQNIQKLNVRVAIGLGGTFDYLAGKRPTAPKFMHYMGLEWLWRLITQPWRIKRIWNAVPVFIWKVYKYKKYGS